VHHEDGSGVQALGGGDALGLLVCLQGVQEGLMQVLEVTVELEALGLCFHPL
jgi:hypothetical protein